MEVQGRRRTQSSVNVLHVHLAELDALSSDLRRLLDEEVVIKSKKTIRTPSEQDILIFELHKNSTHQRGEIERLQTENSLLLKQIQQLKQIETSPSSTSSPKLTRESFSPGRLAPKDAVVQLPEFTGPARFEDIGLVFLEWIRLLTESSSYSQCISLSKRLRDGTNVLKALKISISSPDNLPKYLNKPRTPHGYRLQAVERGVFPSEDTYTNFIKLQKTLFAVLEKSLDDLHYLGEQYANSIPPNVQAELETARSALVKIASEPTHKSMEIRSSS